MTDFDKKWFLNIKKVDSPKATIICLPCGGGSAAFFWNWKTIPLEVNIWALKLPGRDNRITEAAITSANEVVSHILQALPTHFDHPIIFYGHSMGAGIAFEMILALQAQKRQLPSLLIASGREPPHCEYRFTVQHLNDDALLQYIQKLGGVSQKIPTNPEFLQQYLPKIRADYQLNSDLPRREIIKLPLSIAIINGDTDPLIRADKLAHWEEYTELSFESIFLAGDHFFMETNPEYFISRISKMVTTILGC